MSTFNGRTIITLPAFPAAPKSIEWNLMDVVGESASPFSLQSQFQDWQQARLSASVSYQPMTDFQARAWIAFFMACRGKLSVFSFGDPKHLTTTGSGGTVTGSGQTGFTLNCTATGMQPGDWIQIGLRLYAVTAQGSGNLSIWPPIRESPADGTSIVTSNCTGMFCMKSNVRKYSINDMSIYGFTMEIEEQL